jgi:hypothetical protein
MKRLSVLFILSAFIMVGLQGCPVWDDGRDISCRDGFGCGGSPNGSGGGAPGCSSPKACPEGTCGDDGQCHTGDCTLWGCVSGFTCEVGTDDFANCVSSGQGGSAGGSTTTNPGGGGAGGGTGGAGGAGGGSAGAPGSGGAGGEVHTTSG